MCARWKKNRLPQVEIIEKWDETDDTLYAPGVLLHVNGGKKLLYTLFSEEPGTETYCTLMFREQPLFQFQGGEYYCPTCEKIVRSGYQAKQADEFDNEKLNSDNMPFSDALDAIMPLLGLLDDNYYVILDTELYPTDGNGHLFWNVSANNKPLAGSCMFYRGDGKWGSLRPHFTIATQSVKRLCQSRVDYYREHSDCRAVAYYMDGNLTALIDGHHKAMAAALDHKTVKALVILPCYSCNYAQNDGQFKTYAVAGEMRFPCDGYTREIIPFRRQENGMKLSIPDTDLALPFDNDELVSYYPDVAETADIDEVGEISDERLDQILAEKHICKIDEIDLLIKALGGLRHERLFEVADYFLRHCSYISFLRIHETDIVMDIVKQLFKIPRTPELEHYLIDLMVMYEDEYPLVGDKILEYL